MSGILVHTPRKEDESTKTNLEQDDDVGLKKITLIAPARYIRMSGFLKKKKRTKTGENTRFFVLTNLGVYYFRKSTTYEKVWSALFGGDDESHQQSVDAIPVSICGELRGCIKLQDMAGVSTNGKEMTINTSTETFTLMAASEFEASLWVDEMKSSKSQMEAKLKASLAGEKEQRDVLTPYPIFPKPDKSDRASKWLLRKGASCADIIAMGVLDKERDGAIRVGWCKRLFVLTRMAMFYFRREDIKSKDDDARDWRMFGEQRGIIPISKIDHCRTSLKTNAGGFILFSLVLLGGREIVLRSKSRTVVSEWVTCVNAAKRAISDDRSDDEDEDGFDTDDESAKHPSVGRTESADEIALSSMLEDGVSRYQVTSTPKFVSPSSTSEMIHTFLVLIIVNITVYVLSDPYVKNQSALWYVLVTLLNALVWYLIDQTFELRRQLVLLDDMQSEMIMSLPISPAPSLRVGNSSSSSKSNVRRSKKRDIIGPIRFGGYDDDHEEMFVGALDPSLFKIRSREYKKTKVKVQASKSSMYRFVSMHAFRSPDRNFPNIVETGKMSLPVPSDEMRKRCDDCGVPYNLVIYMKAPRSGVSIWSSARPSEIVHLVWVWTVTERFLESIEDSSKCTNSERLTQKWFRESPHNVSTKNRLKMIVFCENFEVLNLGSMFAGYNGKPAMITRSSTIYTGRDYLEVDIDIMVFKKLAQTMLQQSMPMAPLLKLRFGFTIQGNSEDELPEQMLGCFFASKADMGKIRSIGENVSVCLANAASNTKSKDNDGNDEKNA